MSTFEYNLYVLLIKLLADPICLFPIIWFSLSSRDSNGEKLSIINN